MATTTITIPRTLGAAQKKLASVDALLTARGWERCAVVWAFCAPQQGSRTSGENPQSRMTFNEFADQNIAGLRDKKTVSNCWHAWNRIVAEDEKFRAEPGATITLPDAPFPPVTRTDRTATLSKDRLAGRRLTGAANHLRAAISEGLKWNEVDEIRSDLIAARDDIEAALNDLDGVSEPQSRANHPAGRQISESLPHAS